MKYCGNCGNELKEGSKFCSKCGASAPSGSAGDKREPEAKPPKEPVSAEWLKGFATLMYIILGATAYAFSQLAITYMAVSRGFSITLAVMGLLVDIAFCAFGVIKFILYVKSSKEEKQKTSLANKVYFAVNIIVTFTVFMLCVAVFAIL